MRVEVPPGSDFTLANLPLGVGGLGGTPPRAYAAIGDHAIDLDALASRVRALRDLPPGVLARPTLNPFLSLGPDAWRAVRAVLHDVLSGDVDDRLVVARRALRMRTPIDVADFVDMYAGIHHATNLGRMFRPESEPLLPNWRRFPVGYHGRAGTVVISGTDVVRPRGQIPTGDDVRLEPTRQLDVEAELGVVVGVGSRRGEPVPVDRFDDHVFGFVLVNDWSARDIQAFEYQPLGPFLGKSFATSISAWVVPCDALAPHLVAGMTDAQAPEPAPYLRGARPSIPALRVELALETEAMRAAGLPPEPVSAIDVVDALYWSPAQQLAHATVNGASVRTGDLFASGTLSGPDPRAQGGSLIELTWRGTEPVRLPTGEERTFLADGDRAVLRAWCGEGDARVGFGALSGTVRPAR